MVQQAVDVMILAAGRGSRLGAREGKVFVEVGGRAMLAWVLEVSKQVGERVVVVASDKGWDVGVPIAVQDTPKGTGDAVRCGLETLGDVEGRVVVVAYGDTPLVRAETLQKMVRQVREGAEVAVCGFAGEGEGYGRVVQEGKRVRIVEARDGKVEGLCHAGFMVVAGETLARCIPKLAPSAATGEVYFTALVEQVENVAVVECDESEAVGVNDGADLVRVEELIQERLRARAVAQGALLTAPQTVFLAWDTELAQGVRVEPWVVFGGGVKVEAGSVIRAFSYLEGVRVGGNAEVGPFARLRPGVELGEGAKAGTFVELKKAVLGAGAKVPHLAYVGDAEIGVDANVGAGTITCNWDGKNKHITKVGAGAFVGSNTSLVAPVEVGAGAFVGAGSVIDAAIPADALALERAKLKVVPNWRKGKQ